MLRDRFSVCLSVTLAYCGQTAGWSRIPLGMKVCLSPGDNVLHGDPASPTERGTAAPPAHVLAYVYCGQMVAYLSNCWGLVFNVFIQRECDVPSPRVIWWTGKGWCYWVTFAWMVEFSRPSRKKLSTSVVPLPGPPNDLGKGTLQ